MDEIQKKVFQKAITLATDKHRGQEWGFYPYIIHLDRTALILQEFEYYLPIYQVTAWLHDIVEDTDVSQSYINSEFPHSIAVMIAAVTDPEGKSRSIRKSLLYSQLREYPLAIPLKLADRLCNVREASLWETKHLEMYRDEFPDFKEVTSVNTDRQVGYMIDEIKILLSL